MPVTHVIFFFNDTATTEIYTLSLHDALPISSGSRRPARDRSRRIAGTRACGRDCTAHEPGREVPARDRVPSEGTECAVQDRKSTCLNSSHANISYAVFCLKKKNKRRSASRRV